MTYLGTRPPTVDEWEKYELHHRSRMSTKPGITGMWQVSGRSDITDFEEVVRLDAEYIEHWTIGLDIKILIKTVLAVVKHDLYDHVLCMEQLMSTGGGWQDQVGGLSMGLKYITAESGMRLVIFIHRVVIFYGGVLL